MPNSSNNKDNISAIREAFSQYLGVTLSDTQAAALLDGKDLTLDDLLATYSLAEVGNTLIRMETLAQMGSLESSDKQCPRGFDGYWPFCWPSPQAPPEEAPPEEEYALRIGLNPNWFEDL